MGTKIEKGKYVRIKGNVTIYSPYKKRDGIFIGGSTWTVKNPLIRLGKCKHNPKKVKFRRACLSNKKIYYEKGKEEIRCSDCGYIIKLGKEIADNTENGK